MMLYVFIHGLTGRIFKILPLKEAELAGEESYLASYMDSLVRDMLGATDTFPELCSMQEFVTTLNIVQFLKHNDITQEICKQEVFKALRLLNSIEKKLGGADHV
nr:MAG TPA: hypothetical protein [Caudoviricetes sp.]